MKYLITGGQGVIGKRLVEHIKKDNNEVVVVDIKTGLGEEDLSVDVTRFEELWTIFNNNKIDVVIHMAGEVGRMVGELRPNRMIYTNVSGTLNLIQLCIKFDAKLVLLSTSEVYGDMGELKYDEDIEEQMSFKPTNVYALSKHFAEQLARHYNINYGLKVIRIRPFMVYGPGEYPGHYRSAMANFIYSALHEKRIVVHRGAVRSWTFVADFIDGLLLAAIRGNYDNCEAYNIGRDDSRSMEEIAKIIIGNTHNNYDLYEIQESPKKFLSLVKKASFDKAEKKLGFTAKIPVEEGIKQTINWQREFIS